MDHSKWEKIKTFIFDVDGVFTDGKLMITEEGHFLRSMSVRDGMALKVAVKYGYTVAIITKGDSVGVRTRLLALGAHHLYDGVKDKNIPFAELVDKHGIDPHTALYMGDDLADLRLFPKVLLATAPNDACHEVLEAAEFISAKKGGDGAVRDVIERALRVQGCWGVED